MSRYRYAHRAKKVSAWEAVLAFIIIAALFVGLVALAGGIFTLAWNLFVPLLGGPTINFLAGVGAVILIMFINAMLRRS